jgi:hypothetical protein
MANEPPPGDPVGAQDPAPLTPDHGWTYYKPVWGAVVAGLFGTILAFIGGDKPWTWLLFALPAGALMWGLIGYRLLLPPNRRKGSILKAPNSDPTLPSRHI